MLASDNGYFKFKSVSSGRINEVQGGGLNAGDNIDQYDDNNQYHGQWRLAAPGTLKSAKIDNLNTDISDDSIEFYPNPTTDIITMTNIPAKTTIILSNLSGQIEQQMISQEEKNDLEICVNNLRSGVYLIQIDDTERKTFKFIKQ